MNSLLYDALEAIIVQLQNENYASPEAQALLDFTCDLVLAEYRGEVMEGVVVEENLWLDE